MTTRLGMLRVAQAGLTLVEMAIVLIVIALLISAIFVGQELVLQARVKSATADFSGVTAMYHAYRDRYRAAPGDDAGAAVRWPGAVSGNGDGVVAGAYNNVPCAATVESCSWWDHLRRAGLLSGSGTVQPFNAANGILGVQTGDGGTPPGPVLGGPLGAGGLVGLLLCSSNLPEKIAAAVDLQMDDGVRTTGAMRGMLQSAPNPPTAVDATAPGAGGAASYVETGSNVYTLCSSI